MKCAFDRTTEAEHVPFAAQRDPEPVIKVADDWLVRLFLALDVPPEKRTEVS